MADLSKSGPKQAQTKLEQLRARAQQHLAEIADLDTQEAARAKQIVNELDMEARRRRSKAQHPMKEVAITNQLMDEQRGTGPKLRTAQGIATFHSCIT
jgi:hypothetical protein